MFRTAILLVLATLGVTLPAEQVQAWGGFRGGRTFVGGGGFYHSSVGGFRGAYGGAYHAGVTGYSPYTGLYHYGTTGARGVYGGGATYSGYHTYSPSYYGGYYGGGV